jgi:hypothetical protein
MGIPFGQWRGSSRDGGSKPSSRPQAIGSLEKELSAPKR